MGTGVETDPWENSSEGLAHTVGGLCPLFLQTVLGKACHHQALSGLKISKIHLEINQNENAVFYTLRILLTPQLQPQPLYFSWIILEIKEGLCFKLE